MALDTNIRKTFKFANPEQVLHAVVTIQAVFYGTFLMSTYFVTNMMTQEFSSVKRGYSNIAQYKGRVYPF